MPKEREKGTKALDILEFARVNIQASAFNSDENCGLRQGKDSLAIRNFSSNNNVKSFELQGIQVGKEPLLHSWVEEFRPVRVYHMVHIHKRREKGKKERESWL